MPEQKSGGMDVRKVAELARLELPDELAERLQKEMEAIVGYVEMLSELDVAGIEPTAHAVQRVNVTAEDIAGTPFTREEMLANAPDTVNGELVKVPQVLPGEGMA